MAGQHMSDRRFHLTLRSDESEYDDVAHLWIWRLPSPLLLTPRKLSLSTATDKGRLCDGPQMRDGGWG